MEDTMKTVQQVMAEFPPQVLARYDFSNASYKGALVPMTGIVCYKHGVFQQYSAQFRKDGAGCPECGEEKRVEARRMDPTEFLARAEIVHPGRFDYSKTSYINMTTKVTVTCRKHGDFKISPIKLVHGAQGCPTCGAALRGIRVTDINPGSAAGAVSIAKHAKTYVSKAKKVHGDRYSYDNTVYSGAKNKVTIRCAKHGDFQQIAEHHIKRGQGCPRCGQKSAPEDAVAAYLSTLTTVMQRDRTIIAPKELDIYLPEHKLAVEFCGMYWHSHGDKDDERKNKQRHAQKYQLCAAKGIRLITLYETEWAESAATIKRMLRNAIGKTRGKLMARKCELKKPTVQEARAFYNKYHPQGGAGHGEHYGLYWKGKLVACMRFNFGSNDRGHGAASRTWTLGRYATRLSVAGAASRLFKAFLDEHKPSEVKSFSDNRLFSGAMYSQLGFMLEADVPADYQVWSPKLGLRPKPHYQRRVLPARLRDHGVQDSFDPETDTRTEAEMTYLMGGRRIYDCGKKRWVWKPSTI
jgi:G:T-mismatch repair DNA endonuclease (very short patch repair protein)